MVLLLHPFADFLIHLWGFIRTPHHRSEVLWLVSVCDVEKQKLMSSSPPRGKSYGKQSLWDLLLCPSWPKTMLGRDCMPKWASAGASGFIQVMEQPVKVGAHYLLWLIKRSLYHQAFESAFNGFSSWFWFLTGCGHLTKKKRAGKGIFNPKAQVGVFQFASVRGRLGGHTHMQEASVCWVEAAAFGLCLS